MESDEVIILSSPGIPTQHHGRFVHGRHKLSGPALSVINISDSDSDQDCWRSNQVQVSPRPRSRDSKKGLNVRVESPAPVQSDRVKGKQPLFLPSDDNDDETDISTDDDAASTEQDDFATASTSQKATTHGMDGPTAHSSGNPVAPSTPTLPQTDPFDQFLAQVLEIIPDVEPTYAMNLIRAQHPTSGSNVVATALHSLFESTYPKREKNKGKRKREDSDDGGPSTQKVKVDYACKDRPFTGGVNYYGLAMEQLMVDFPYVPKPHIRKTMGEHGNLYAPSHFALARETTLPQLPYQKKTQAYRPKGKGPVVRDQEFLDERAWLLLQLKDEGIKKDRIMAEEANEQEYAECGDGIECGCCFTTNPFDVMVQCPDAHLFCKTCMISYAENRLGEYNPNLVCMDQSGCKLCFSDSELRRFLTPKLLELYERVKQRKEIEAAQIEGLEECPFCEYKVVIENEQEKLFRCERPECAAVSCRQCKKLDHLPKTCQEADKEKHLDGQHAIEEAMTAALMRNCPKCQKAFIKDAGCNKMTCPNCGTLSCYTCRKAIQGYDHFQTPQGCVLWDNVEARHANEVNAAAKKAMEEYKRNNPGVNDTDLNISLVKTPPPPTVPPGEHMLHQQFLNHIAAPPLQRLPQRVVQGAEFLHAYHNLHFQRPGVPPPLLAPVQHPPPIALLPMARHLQHVVAPYRPPNPPVNQAVPAPAPPAPPRPMVRPRPRAVVPVVPRTAMRRPTGRKR